MYPYKVLSKKTYKTNNFCWLASEVTDEKSRIRIRSADLDPYQHATDPQQHWLFPSCGIVSILLGQIAGHILRYTYTAHILRYTYTVQRSGLENGLWKRGANAYPLVSRIHTTTVEAGYFETPTLYGPTSTKNIHIFNLSNKEM
jgi:hypothetical protein